MSINFPLDDVFIQHQKGVVEIRYISQLLTTKLLQKTGTGNREQGTGNREQGTGNR